MANYKPASRTNYFKVKDPEAFRKTVNENFSFEDFDLWEKTNENGETVFGFGGFDNFTQVYNEEKDEYTDIAALIQPHLPEGEAVIIIESGYEKLRYVVGTAYIITHDNAMYLSIADIAIEKAKELIGNPDKEFNMHY